jgi:hypothetical protein
LSSLRKFEGIIRSKFILLKMLLKLFRSLKEKARR